MNKTVIAVLGPTAIGKTTLSLALAKYFSTEIISCDSRQFYKEMSIGTAVPGIEELQLAKHYFIQNRSIFEDYSVGEFEKDALQTLSKIFENNNCAIMVGGSGLYANAVINGLDDFPDVPSEIREHLNQEIKNGNIKALQLQLKTLDIESYKTIEIENPHRLVRALEICIGTGLPYSSFKNKPKIPRDFSIVKIGLFAEREILYSRINNRVDSMIELGLVEEAKKLYAYKNLNALQTVGYRELFDYFDGKYTLDFAISEIKKNTRRFAKRQLTWYRKDPEINWFSYTEDYNKICAFVEKKLSDD
jgi:tRNA dimethylallyltransferase